MVIIINCNLHTNSDEFKVDNLCISVNVFPLFWSPHCLPLENQRKETSLSPYSALCRWRGGGGGVKCLSPQNTSGVSDVNFAEAESNWSQ